MFTPFISLISFYHRLQGLNVLSFVPPLETTAWKIENWMNNLNTRMSSHRMNEYEQKKYINIKKKSTIFAIMRLHLYLCIISSLMISVRWGVHWVNKQWNTNCVSQKNIFTTGIFYKLNVETNIYWSRLLLMTWAIDMLSKFSQTIAINSFCT